MTRQTITSYDDVITFGKYRGKGKTIRWIVDNDPEYIMCLDEEGIVELPADILEAAQQEYADNSPPESYYWQPD